MKLWIDDVRRSPDDYFWVRNALGAKTMISMFWKGYLGKEILIDLGGSAAKIEDCIEILNWLEKEKIVDDRFSFHIHSKVLINARNIIQRNQWKEV